MSWEIGQKLIQYIENTVTTGSTILELGSGEGTRILAKKYRMYSVEHDMEWMGKYQSNYLYTPLKQHKEVKNHVGNIWYDADILREHLLGLDYHLLLVDGPPTYRAGFVKYFSLFNPDVVMVFDDLQRHKEIKIMNSIAGRLDVPYVVYTADGKMFGVINDPCLQCGGTNELSYT